MRLIVSVWLFFGIAWSNLGAGRIVEAAETQNGKVVVVFVDLSASIKDMEVYRDGWRKILGRLNGEDRIVLGRITSETLTTFRPVVDETLPTFNWSTDNKLRHEKKVKEQREKLIKSFDETLKGPKSPKTDIVNSFLLAKKILRPEKRRRVLVVMSDMLEDSEQYNFEQQKVTDSVIREIIEKKRKTKQLPDLAGTTVYVAGASAKTASKALEVQQFWMEYCKAVNAVLTKENYASALINFAE